jgi:arginyl-tRNA synthetase
MTAIEQLISKQVIEAMASIYNAAILPEAISIQETRKEFKGDCTLVVFPLIRASKKGPEETAAALGGFLLQTSMWLKAF